MATRPKLARREDGQALVELSLCAGFLCLMLLAVWQVGSIFSNYIDISEAARAGARAAALSGAPTAPGDTASLTTAKSEGQYAALCSVSSACTISGSNVKGINVTITEIGVWQAGSQVQATVTAPYSLSLMGVSISNGTLSVSDYMRVHRKGA